VTGAAAAPWRDLRLRLASALLLGPAVLGGIWLGGPFFTALIVMAVAGLAWEWVRMCGGRLWPLSGGIVRPLRGGPGNGVMVPLAALAAAALAAMGEPLAAALLLLPGAVLAHSLAPGAHGRFLAAGVLYVGLAGIALIALRQDPAAGRANVIFLILVVWASDSAAYLAGRALGGPRLWPAVSPGKTWSGAAGGLAGAMLVGALSTLVAPGPWLGAALVGGGLGLLAQAGDLLESGIKRHFGVKDSSRLIPGHGGLLDRLDGLLASAPAAAGLGLVLGAGEYLWRV